MIFQAFKEILLGQAINRRKYHALAFKLLRLAGKKRFLSKYFLVLE